MSLAMVYQGFLSFIALLIAMPARAMCLPHPLITDTNPFEESEKFPRFINQFSNDVINCAILLLIILQMMDVKVIDRQLPGSLGSPAL
jgi:hypothetical protein